VAAPKQRNTAAEREAIKAGKSAAEIWRDQPAKAAQKNTDARWTLKFAKARALPDHRLGIDIAIPSFGYKSSIAICRHYGFIHKGKVTDGARCDERMLREVVNRKRRFAFSSYLYRQRNLVEPFFNRIKQFRGIATRYDKDPASLLAAIKLICVRLWCNAK
jgi:hypothetical protein